MNTVQVRLPNSVLLEEVCTRDVSGIEFLESVCKRLGVYETDFFGLKRLKKGNSYWLFLRRPLFDQIHNKNSRIMLCVKRFVDPSKIQQTTTKRMYYHELKDKIRIGDITLEEKYIAKAGALMCRLEKLSGEVRAGRSAVITRFFPEQVWSQNLSWDINQQLKQLEGKSDKEIMGQYLQIVSQARGYGLYTFSADIQYNRDIILTIGNGSITLSDRNTAVIHNLMSIQDIMEISYTEKKLTITSKKKDTNGDHMTLCTRFCSRKLTREIFRCLTEHHVFVCQRSVPEGILFHRYKPSRIGLNKGSYFLFNLIRTQEESYAYHWTRLHRMDEGTQLQLEDSTLSYGKDNDDVMELDMSDLKRSNSGITDSSLDSTLNGLDISKISVEGGEKRIKQEYCKICYANRVKTVFCPCGHSVSCISCAKLVNTCPICRKSIAYKQTIFTV
ncbi:E3 ubiquitin-protein ligase MYLIP-like [Oopsacas minuta]|uniref:E3 ubiquitin-protein ligase MYLIP-like n=1 Tax=Oopsacas minuta TaxID=111878 RepID=A0AAV7JNL7_9METZ|nr:E3 ubiquitin-protein ligase MYLIP-like [Oopsacas minuta]